MDLRLSRRTLFGGALVALAATATAGCTPASGAGPASSSLPTPPDGQPVAQWTQTGGFLMPGLLALRAPRLAVYGDGSTIADAAYQAKLTRSDLQGLVSHLITALTTPSVGKPKSPPPQSTVDAPTTVLQVWSGRAMATVSATALDETRTEGVYASALYDARDRFDAVYKQVTATAQPYLAERIRVVTQPAPAAATGAGAAQWPAQVALPSAPDPAGATVHHADLEGSAARDAVQVLTRDLDERGAWPTYRCSDGSLVQASWRFLLPSE